MTSALDLPERKRLKEKKGKVRDTEREREKRRERASAKRKKNLPWSFILRQGKWGDDLYLCV